MAFKAKCGGTWRQENQEFKVILNYIRVLLSQEKNKN